MGSRSSFQGLAVKSTIARTISSLMSYCCSGVAKCEPQSFLQGSSKLEGTFSFVAAYSGGSCYRIAGSLHCGETEWIPLYDTEILLEDDTVSVLITTCHGFGSN